MPVTHGLVQRTKLNDQFTNTYWVYIGPSPTDTELFALSLLEEEPGLQFAYRNRMAEEISGALFSRREVIVTSPESSQVIIGVEVVSG